MSQAIELVVMAGGQGSRFWPISRKSLPKQFLCLSDENESLIQATVRRLETLSDNVGVNVVCGNNYADLVKEHVPRAELLLEPCAKNTAAAIGLAAIHLKKKNPQTTMVVLPADHAVSNESILRDTIKKACDVAAEHGALVTVGIQPESPHTGYGYIQEGVVLGEGVFRVKRFYEKPNYDRACHYFKSGGFYWNSGMFVWTVEAVLSALEKHMPELYQGLLEIEEVIGTPACEEIEKQVFDRIESISIDFGVLEHSTECAVVAAEPFGWNDIGSWDAWAEHFEKDDAGNMSRGDVLMLDASGCIVRSDKRFTAVIGATDMVVIDSGDALLVCPKSRVQDVKKVVTYLESKERKELL